MGRHEGGHGGPGRVVEGLARQVVDACHHGQIVGHEFVEAHVDGPVGRQGVALFGATAQHALEPVRPVGAHVLHIHPVMRQAGRVGDHGHHRRGDRDRVAVGHDERGVRERVDEGGELLKVLGCLQHPAGAAPQPLQHLEDLAQVGIGGPLIACQVGVAPGRHRRRRLEQHGREVDSEQLDLLVCVLDRHFVHPVEIRQGPIEERQGHVGAGQARVGLAGRRTLGVGQHRFQALPVGERPQGRVG